MRMVSLMVLKEAGTAEKRGLPAFPTRLGEAVASGERAALADRETAGGGDAKAASGDAGTLKGWLKRRIAV
jgi:predicted deacylase